MMLITGWLALSVVVGVVAAARGRDTTGYFLLSLVLSPLIGLLIVAALPSRFYVDGLGVRRRVVTERQWMRENDPRGAARQRLWERVVAIAVVAAVLIAAWTGMSGACSPAPACWTKYGPEYVRSVCLPYARDQRTLKEISEYLDEPEKIADFVRACERVGVRLGRGAR